MLTGMPSYIISHALPALSVKMLSESEVLPVRNTFLHFPDSEAPNLKRSVTAPLTGRSKVDDNRDHSWSASKDEDDGCNQGREDKHIVEKHGEDSQPYLERVVTRDPFESPCSSAGTGDGHFWSAA